MVGADDTEGRRLGLADGDAEGAKLMVGAELGTLDGDADGNFVGESVGDFVGALVGDNVGVCVGPGVGERVHVWHSMLHVQGQALISW